MRLATYLKRNRITPEEFGQLVGIHITTVYRILQGDSFPKSSNLKKIAEVTGGLVNPNDFINLPKRPIAPGRGRPRKDQQNGASRA